MSDLINRQDIIEKLRKHKMLFCKNRIEYSSLSKDEKARVDEIDNCIVELLNAPSAESDQNFDHNDPLTWEELKQMEGKPVWVENEYHKKWLIVMQVNDINIIFDGNGYYTQGFQVCLGKTWQAYRKERE